MPLLNGFKAIEEVRKIYNLQNEKIIQNYKSESALILPNFVMITDYFTSPDFKK